MYIDISILVKSITVLLVGGARVVEVVVVDVVDEVVVCMQGKVPRGKGDS